MALDTAAKIVNPMLILIVQDLLNSGLLEHEICQWLHTPNTELDFHPPMELCLTGQGGQVRSVIEKAKGRAADNLDGLRVVEEAEPEE